MTDQTESDVFEDLRSIWPTGSPNEARGAAIMDRAATEHTALRAAHAATEAQLEAMREGLCFLGKWIERGQFDKSISPAAAISVMAYLPGMPWNSERWDVDHKPYAAAYYKAFPKTARTALKKTP